MHVKPHYFISICHFTSLFVFPSDLCKKKGGRASSESTLSPVIVDRITSHVHCLSLDNGTLLRTFSFDRAGLEDPRGIAVTPEGHLVVTDRRAVRIVDCDGRPLHAFPAEVSTVLDWLPEPRSVATGRDGRIVVVDAAREAVFIC
jgi:hypothetical protein